MAAVHEARVKKRKAAVEAAEQELDGLDASAAVEPAKENEDEDEVEVEVLSHAEQRKRRRLEKKKLKQAVSTQDGDADAAATVEAVDGGPGARGNSKSEPGSSKAEQPKQSRSTYGIWVGNLAFKTDADKVCLLTVLALLQLCRSILTSLTLPPPHNLHATTVFPATFV